MDNWTTERAWGKRRQVCTECGFKTVAGTAGGSRRDLANWNKSIEQVRNHTH